MVRLIACTLLLAGCNETGVLNEVVERDFAWSLEQPTYGSFSGDRPVRVKGSAGTDRARVVVEGRRIPLAPDGSFDILVEMDGPYRILDITASHDTEEVEERLPVFAGFDPRETWPGGLSMRLTDSGLGGLEVGLGAAVDGLLDSQLGGGTPLEANGFTLQLTALDHAPTAVRLNPSEAGIDAGIELLDISVELMISGEVGGFPINVPATLTLPAINVGIVLLAEVGEGGAIGLSINEPVIEFEPPEIALGAVGLDWLTDLLFNNLDIEQLIADQIDGLVTDSQVLELGEGLDFETDLLGMSLALRLAELSTDALGVGLAFSVGLDEPAPEGTPVAPPTGDFGERVDFAVAVHEGILQPLLDSDLLDLLEQDIQLPNPFGFILGNLVTNLPGGGQAPESAGWCLGLTPGDAKLARFVEGDGNLMAIYLPDAVLDFGRMPEAGGACESWLTASLALEVGLGLDGGTSLALDISAPEGKVLYYGATDVREDEVIEELAGVLGSLLDLVGGFANIDLGDLVGAGGGEGGLPLDGLSLEVAGAQPVPESPGLYEIGIRLYDPELSEGL